MPPPESARPLLTVRPEMVAVAPDVTLKMRKSGVPLAKLRWMVRRVAPGPEMVRFLPMSSSALVSSMVPLTAKSIVSPAAASAIALRNDPGPLSAVLMTVPACANKF